MGKVTKSSKRGQISTTLLVLAVLAIALAPRPAQGAFNEARWFLQNVCLAKTHELLGAANWSRFESEARESRTRLERAGVPEVELRHLEETTRRLIVKTTTESNKHEGPDICIQWYRT